MTTIYPFGKWIKKIEAVALVRAHRNYKGLADWLVRLGEVESYRG